MKKLAQRIYGISTGLVCLALAGGGLADILHLPVADRVMTRLGYPEYFQEIIGVWKILGVVALLVPGRPVLKEWAYAGMVFDVTGAALSHLAVGDRLDVLPPLVILALVIASHRARPPGRRCPRPKRPTPREPVVL